MKSSGQQAFIDHLRAHFVGPKGGEDEVIESNPVYAYLTGMLFPVEDGDQIMLVTNGGQVIRVPVDAGPDNRIRIVGRSSQGVTVFNTAEDEKVVSVERISEPEGEDEDGADEPEVTPEA